MRCLSVVLASFLVTIPFGSTQELGKTGFDAQRDWPFWRGPERNGHADPHQKLPTLWSETENVLWKTPIPGRGHGACIVVGDRVFLATADNDKESQTVLCLDRKTGQNRWSQEIHQGGFAKGGNAKSSHASATVACDGQRVFANFLHQGAIFTTALDLDGKQLWQTKITDYTLHQGFASSPAIYQGLVLVSADNKGTGLIAALDRATGAMVWKQERPKFPNYASPIILHVAGKDQLILIGCELVSSFNPLTGEKFWEIKGSTTECVTSTPTDGDLIFTSGGFPKNHVAGVKADGSGKVAWENPTKVYVPSMLTSKGYLYGVQDGGIAFCWKADTGKEMWKQRLEGNFSASPVLVGDTVFAASELGRTFIWKANPEKYEEVAQNQLGDEVMATPTICGDRIYLRVARKEKGQRLETLYCIGRK